MRLRIRGTRIIVAAAMLWAGFHVCWMPQANCEQPKPPCHHQGGAPAHSCCGGLHLCASAEPNGASALGPDRTEGLLFAALHAPLGLIEPRAEAPASGAGPPGYSPPILASSPSRSPPAV